MPNPGMQVLARGRTQLENDDAWLARVAWDSSRTPPAAPRLLLDMNDSHLTFK